MLNIDKIRKDFPILKIQSNNKPLIFFDNGASSQKPQVVLDKINEIYKTKYANIHRGIYDLSQQATEAYEESRKIIQKFLNAKSEKEIIFVRGATEAINLVAQSFGLNNFKKGDEVILSQMEHHSNIVPWQLLRDRLGIKINVIPINQDGDIDLNNFKKFHKKNLCHLLNLFDFDRNLQICSFFSYHLLNSLPWKFLLGSTVLLLENNYYI